MAEKDPASTENKAEIPHLIHWFDFLVRSICIIFGAAAALIVKLYAQLGAAFTVLVAILVAFVATQIPNFWPWLKTKLNFGGPFSYKRWIPSAIAGLIVLSLYVAEHFYLSSAPSGLITASTLPNPSSAQCSLEDLMVRAWEAHQKESDTYARALFAKAHECDVSSPRPIDGLGRLDMDEGSFQVAAERYRVLISAGRGDLLLYQYELAEALDGSGQYDEFVKELIETRKEANLILDSPMR